MSDTESSGVEREQPKPAQPVSRDLEYVQDHESLLGLPLLCWECGGDVENDSHQMILLSDGNAVCRGCSEVADEVVATSLRYGYPNNNVGLDLDEATRWYRIEDRLDLDEIGAQGTDVDRGDGPRTDGGTPADGVERQRDENECPECGSEGVPNPVLEDWYECPTCVISFNAAGEVDDEQR